VVIGKLNFLEGLAIHEHAHLALGVGVLHSAPHILHRDQGKQIIEGAVNPPAVVNVPECDVDGGFLFASVVLLKVDDLIDVVLMPDYHASLEWRGRHDKTSRN
jgi:hypothetical protein